VGSAGKTETGSVIGSTLLNYRVGAELGSGGLGTVYLGEHTIIGRRAALKILNPRVATDEHIVSRFLAEARAVNAIRHPNIVEVTDYGQCAGLFVIIMELLEGETLAQRLDTVGRIEESQALAMLLQTASAIAAAHDRGIVHRDLKPENLFLTAYPDYPDFVKVLDFGIAKLSGDMQNSAHTTPGLIMGTPAFMSPEQCMGDDGLDHRSDVYSFGVVAYRVLSGRLPYEGSNPMQVMHGHLNGQAPPVRCLEPRISQEMETLVSRCMARLPADRFSSMHDLRKLLVAMGARSPLAFNADEMADEGPPSRRPPVSSTAPTQPGSEGEGATTSADAPRGAATSSDASAVTNEILPVESSTKTWVRPGTQLGPTASGTWEDDRFERAEAVAVAAHVREFIVQKLKSDSLKLPALPEVAVKCLELAHDPDVRFSSIAALIERDPFIATRVIRLANSALFGGLARITSIEGAVARLGIRSLVGLLQELAAEQVFVSRDPAIRDAFRGIWEHCLGVAHLARDLAGVVRGTNPNTAYLAGLFHDIGKPVVASLLLENEKSTPTGRLFVTGGVWKKVVDELHRDVGAILALRWFLPREVAGAIAQLDGYDLKRGRNSCANVVRLANALCAQEGMDIKVTPPEELERVILQGRQVLGLRSDQLAKVVEGLPGKIRALTQKPELDTTTRVFDRSAL
jgi:putative nucleotidyltransferase with HDIG domain